MGSRPPQPHQTGMIEARQHVDLGPETADARGLDAVQELDGDRSIGLGVGRPEHFRHPAAPQDPRTT